MSVQPAASSRRRPVTARSIARRARLDPPNAFHASHVAFLREPARPDWIRSSDPELLPLLISPLAEATPARRALSRGWKAALAASLAVHLAAAAFLLLRDEDEGVLIAGSQAAGVAMYGNAAADDSMAGETEATSVTIVPLTLAKPVLTVAATEVAEVEPAEVEPAEVIEAVAETVVAETVEAVKPVEELAPAAPTPPVSARPEQSPTKTVEPAPATEAALSDVVPEILAVDTPETTAEEDTVAPVRPEAAQPLEPEAVEEVRAETVVAGTAETPVAAPREVVDAEPEPVKQPPKGVAEQKPLVEMKPAERPAKKADAKAAEKKPAKPASAPARKAEKSAKAGSSGQGRSNAQRGVADGQTDGTRVDKAGKGKDASAGNAAVTNYPGKVRQKISRAASRISRRDRAVAKSDVTVSFTVTASGGLGGVSVARSSGSAALDQAAIAAVRRAAPFPPIPDGAGRKSWQFTIPMGLGR